MTLLLTRSDLAPLLTEPDSIRASFDAIFANVASGVISGSKVACDFALPTPAPGQTIDLSSVRLVARSLLRQAQPNSWVGD